MGKIWTSSGGLIDMHAQRKAEHMVRKAHQAHKNKLARQSRVIRQRMQDTNGEMLPYTKWWLSRRQSMNKYG
jgi:hypothetical protein